MIQEVYNRYVREIILHVYKEGVDLPDRKKIKEIEKKKKLFMIAIQCYADEK